MVIYIVCLICYIHKKIILIILSIFHEGFQNGRGCKAIILCSNLSLNGRPLMEYIKDGYSASCRTWGGPMCGLVQGRTWFGTMQSQDKLGSLSAKVLEIKMK